MSFKIVAFFFIMLPNFSFAACTTKEAAQAESQILNLKSWGAIYKHYKQFAKCDDGSIAEGYTESISKMLSNQWSELNNLENLIKKDEKFKEFVIKHINSTMDEVDRKKILNNAIKNCNTNLDKLCKNIVHAAESN